MCVAGEGILARAIHLTQSIDRNHIPTQHQLPTHLTSRHSDNAFQVLRRHTPRSPSTYTDLFISNSRLSLSLDLTQEVASIPHHDCPLQPQHPLLNPTPSLPCFRRLHTLSLSFRHGPSISHNHPSRLTHGRTHRPALQRRRLRRRHSDNTPSLRRHIYNPQYHLRPMLHNHLRHQLPNRHFNHVQHCHRY